ncbi:MAG: DUF2950 domain-containing protein [Candidatus Acidiferrales bacterium]
MRRSASFGIAILLALFAGIAGSTALRAQTKESAKAASQLNATPQETFATPENAMQALIDAAKAEDQGALAKIFGPEYDKLLSGDPVEDDKDLDDFAAGAAESAQLKKDGENKYTLMVGKDQWSTPIPIVQKDGRWLFDTSAGLQEVLDRRIGENELSAITTCRAYVVAQWEYFTDNDWGHDGVNAYAQKFVSSPGEHDGLFWETAEGEDPSPLGELVAQARAEGYGPANKTNAANSKSAMKSNVSENAETNNLTSGRSETQANSEDEAEAGARSEQGSAQHVRHPYHGYYFKILKQQGSAAPGGKYSYVINGNMIAGFALVAYPAKWNDSGVMTFIVNQQGRVYQKNLGARTDKLASAITTYNPDPSWQAVEP